MADNNYTPSRLLNSSSSIREDLLVRNLYVPNNEYSESNGKINERIVDSLSSIISAVTPFKSYNLKNTVYGRLIENESMLSRIGLTMLGRQFMYNSMSSLVQKNAPILDHKTNMFTKQIDYSITTRSGTTTFEDFIRKTFYYYPKNNFGQLSKNSDYLENTGKGQLQQLFTAINRNIYKPENNLEDQIYYKLADKVKVPIEDRKTLINVDDKIYFDFGSNPYYPFPIRRSTLVSIEDANKSMINSMANLYTSRSYAPTKDVVENYFGSVNSLYTNISAESLDYSSNFNMNSWIDTEDGFDDNIKNKIVWGRDGTIKEVDQNSHKLRGLENNDDINRNEDLSSSKFNIKAGLLEYTRNLVNATEGRVGDLTRKAFANGNEIDGFNGSAVWKAPSTSLPSFAGKTGVRQHSVLDPYDRFSKAIRFNGNIEYESAGNKDSVIYRSVIPKFHPTLNKKGEVDNSNMMFSIENLAVKVIDGDAGSNTKISDDETGVEIPACEVGASNGRVMWFPPYAIEINETSVAKFESTVMVGRSEPMYNYQNSERSATINFTLLIDYTDKLKNLKTNKEIAEFFAFGTTTDNDGYDPTDFIKKSEKRIEFIDEQLKIYNPEPYSEPELTFPEPINIYFPNDIPKVEETIGDVIDNMFKTYTYEILPSVFSSDGGLNGMNKSIYYVSGLTAYQESGKTYYQFFTEPPYSQYTVTDDLDDYGVVEINELIKDIFDNEETRKYYKIEITGAATKLYNGTIADYNKKLGLRRAEAAKSFIEQKLFNIYGKTAEQMKITIITASIGAEGADEATASADSFSSLLAKQRRYAQIKFVKNDIGAGNKEKVLTADQENDKNILINEKTSLQTRINAARSIASNCIMNEREVDDTAILGSFKSITGNYFYSAFHSQTPEDFHKRLTFLQQCTRQGSAIRYESRTDENGIIRSRNSVFGRQPICVLRIGDFFNTKIIIESLNIDYNETTWDMNPEGFGMQPMIAKVTLNIKILGGQSLKGPIDALQNAVSYNYYANSTFSNNGIYKKPYDVAATQYGYRTTDQLNDGRIEKLESKKVNKI